MYIINNQLLFKFNIIMMTYVCNNDNNKMLYFNVKMKCLVSIFK
jgi:hypothetical protein